MLSRNDLLEIKQRLLVSARMCKHLLVHEDDEQEVRLTEEQYPIVVNAMENNEDDVNKILAELDVLRVSSGLFDLLSTGDSHGREQVVSGARQEDVGTDSVGEQPVEEDAAEPVGSGGTDGEDTSRPKPKRNRTRTRKNSKSVVASKKKQKVDSGTTD